MKELFISQMIMSACGVDPENFAHRRAWIYIEVMLFWVNIGIICLILFGKMRILGGGVELFSWVLRIAARCKGNYHEVMPKEESVDLVYNKSWSDVVLMLKERDIQNEEYEGGNE